jgi:glucose/arabinose dehydrogenase
MRPLVLTVGSLVCATTVVTGALSASAQSVEADHAKAQAVPALTVTRMVKGLNLPWDVKYTRGGRVLITERESKHLLTWRAGKLRRVAFPSSAVWAAGETGLMSLATDPDYTKTRRFYTCQGGYTAGGGHDVRVIAWHLNTAATGATRVKTLLTGLPSGSGRHGGCRLLIARNGALIVGTGDAVVGTNPQDLTSLGGKTLRLNRNTGAPWPKNPFISSSNANSRYVLTYGHRNVQGLAQRSDGTVWSVEHGPSRDDEVNQIKGGWNFGWNPVPGYDESTPMTDHSLPGAQHSARWRSGDPTVATSGAAWVRGKEWGAYEGTLAVAALKGQRLMFMRFDSAGTFRGMRTPAALRKFGRLRSVSRLPNNDLMVTTANADGHDSVLRVHPTG